MIARLLKFAVFILPIFFILPLHAADNPTVKYIGIEHGLSNNSVMCGYQDYKGFMWFGTYDGLNRYDGYNFTVFRNRIGDPASLNCNEIYSIAGDKNHNIWIGGRKGISLYGPVKNIFSSVNYLPFGRSARKEITGSISNIIADAYGHVFVPSDKEGFLVFDNNSKTGVQAALETNKGLSSNYRVAVIETDRQLHGAWMIIENVGLCRYNIRTKTIRIVNTSILRGNCLKEDTKGNLWFGNDNGLYRYNIAANTVSQSFIEGNFKISAICIDKKGEIWIGSDGRGVLVLLPGNQKATPFFMSYCRLLV